MRAGVHRSLIIFAIDLLMAGIAFLASLGLRLGTAVVDWPAHAFELALVVYMIVAAAVLWFMRLDSRIWRYFSIDDALAVGRAAVAINLVFLPALFLITRLEDFPRSFMLLNVVILPAMLALPRVVYRLSKDGQISLFGDKRRADQVPVLLVGAGDPADQFIREMARGRNAVYRVVGIIDDKPHRVGRRINGVPVVGTIEELEATMHALEPKGDRPQRVVVADPRLDGARMRTLLDVCDRRGVTLSRLPRLTDFQRHDGDRTEMRPIAVEDLLRRPQAVLDRQAMAELIGGRRVMVTGAGGTIGGELVRQIAALGPSRIILFDNAEYLLYQIDLELKEKFPDLPRIPILGDVRDAQRVGQVMARERPQLVFHAAAFKHVPMVEANPTEGVLTNVIGTRTVADAARAANVEAMVLISTDKAVNPSSVMGATKRLAESYCQSLDKLVRENGDAVRFVTVRFGNVLGSTGSVVPLFQRQLAAGGPLTVTHPDIERYFMTVREAVELVLQASVLGIDQTREGGGIFVLDMGEPVRILELARQMIRLAGLRPEVDVAIEFTGLRPGEKLYEELFYGDENLEQTRVRGLMTAMPLSADHDHLSEQLSMLARAAWDRNRSQTLELLARLVPNYVRDRSLDPADGGEEPEVTLPRAG